MPKKLMEDKDQLASNQLPAGNPISAAPPVDMMRPQGQPGGPQNAPRLPGGIDIQQMMAAQQETSGVPETGMDSMQAEPMQDAGMMEQEPAAQEVQKGFIPEPAVVQAEQQPGGGPMNGITDSSMSSALGQQAVGEQQIINAEMVLMKYKAGKSHLERRIIHDQQWWKLRNWNEIEGQHLAHGSGHLRSNTAWLWNCVVCKHADFVDAYPEPIVLPRAEDDKEEATRLSEVVPVIMEANEFEEVYSDAQWQKLTEGTAVYGCFWDKDKLNGLGDISLSRINVLNLFWEPGITDIQESRNVFLCELVDNDILEQQYPELAGKVKNTKMTLAHYMYDDTVDVTDKSVVVDWYYHKWQEGRKVLHYAKFVGHHVLFSTENDPELAQDGLYDDGLFPFVMDPLYPVEGSPCGMGLIDVGEGAQVDIDVMNQAMVRNTTMSSTPRYFIRKDGSVNEEEFADWTKPLVHVDGNLAQDSIQPVQVASLANLTTTFYSQKIEELKFVTGNVDVNNGSTPSGVTAASAIAALKEDAGRTSKDSNKSAYRAYRKLITMVIERIRQFYDMPRQYRIVGDRGEEQFQAYDNTGLQPQPQMSAYGEDMGMRLPVFDVMVRAQRENAYTKTAQNELAIQFYQLGFFNPQQADMTLMALDMMDFRGKEDLIKKVQEGQTMQAMIQQLVQLSMAIAQQNGDAAAMQAIQQLVMGGGDPMAQQMAAPPQAKKLQQTPEGDATKGGTATKQAVPAAKQMNSMAQRVNNAKVPQ